MNKIFLPLFLLALCGTTPVFSQPEKMHLISFLPDSNELKAWHQTDTARFFSKENLSDLIDGGMDMYFEYGFRYALAAEFQKSGAHAIRVELYEMLDASAAYGVFSLNAGTQGKAVPIGSEALLYTYHLMFWKERFIVFVSADDTLSETRAALQTIASYIDKKLGPPGQKPALVSILPSKELRTAKYFKGILGVSSLYTFDHRNIFHVTEGVEGTYPDHRIFIFSYPDERESRSSAASGLESIKTNSRYTDIQIHETRWTITDRQENKLHITCWKNYILIIIEKKAGTPARINEILHAIQHP